MPRKTPEPARPRRPRLTRVSAYSMPLGVAEQVADLAAAAGQSASRWVADAVIDRIAQERKGARP